MPQTQEPSSLWGEQPGSQVTLKLLVVPGVAAPSTLPSPGCRLWSWPGLGAAKTIMFQKHLPAWMVAPEWGQPQGQGWCSWWNWWRWPEPTLLISFSLLHSPLQLHVMV